ncbi:MAG TPA: AMP-binding protein [Streptosporangiaceae bacterium]|nr:AMP-binding protein [Streptosporangiaceae bacterium]
MPRRPAITPDTLLAQGPPLALASLPELLAANPGHRVRFLSLDGELLTKSFADMHADVTQLMSELQTAGIKAGDFVGVLGPNSYEWAIADLALLGLACVSVALPVERNVQPDELRELTERYRLSALLVTRAVPADAELPPGCAVLESRPLRLSPAQWPVGERPQLPPDVFTIVFSSGTTGSKKGLMLTKEGIENTIRTSMDAWQVGPADDILIVMPFSNFQQRYLLYLAVAAGCDASVVAPERMFSKLKSLEPTIILGPPSFFELVCNRVTAEDLRGRLPYHAAALLHACLPGWAGRGVQARLGRKWTGMYGSRARLMFTGSAPVPPRMVKLFQQLGAPLFELYGSTETGWIAMNLPGRARVGSPGRPVNGVTVEIGSDSEVVVRSQHPQSAGYVFEGVESNPSVFLGDGRIATGDLGYLDGAGFLRLTGRKKNIIITRSGVKINPEELESGIENGCPVTRAMVVPSDASGLLACIVWLDDPESVERMAEVDAYIKRANQAQDAPRRITQVIFRPAKELTVENGFLTRNFKIDRGAVVRAVFGTDGRPVR